MIYGDFKYSHGKTFHVKVLCDKKFYIANTKEVLLQLFTNVLTKKSATTNTRTRVNSN